VCPPYGGGFFTTVFVDDPQHVAALLRARGIYVVPMPGSLRIALSAVRTDDVAELAYALRAAIDEPVSIRPVTLLNPFHKAPAA
jgi:hypothetical protein